jgi:transposase
MLTRMTDEDWEIVLEVFRASCSRRGDKGRDDRKFLAAMHYFMVHNLTWRALPAAFGTSNSVWKRFWRLSRTGVFEAFFEALASLSRTAHLVQMFDSTLARAQVSAAGAQGGQEGEALGRSRGGFSTKIHLKVDLEGLPLAFLSRLAARPVTAHSSRSGSTSDPRSRRARPSVTRGMTPRPTARRRASVASVQPSPTSPRPRTGLLSFPELYTRLAPASSSWSES